MKNFLLITFLIFIPFFAEASSKPAYEWTQIANGIDYAKLSFPIDEGEMGILHAFRIDLQKNKIDVITAQDETNGATAEEMASQNKAMITINGGFFSPEHKSIGLIVKDGKEINAIHRTSWWSIFTIAGNKPAIVTLKEYKNLKDVKLALQVGPRLVIDGTIPKLKASVAARSGIGITSQGKVIIAITEGHGISMNEFAKRMSVPYIDGGLECPNAMALDGGSSSQLYAKIKRFKLSLPGLARVTNGLAVYGGLR